MKTKTCCFSGHRELYPEKIPLLEKELHKIISDCIEKGYRRFLCGGAKGFDFLAAKTLLAHQNTCPEIQLELVFPYHYLPSMWKEIAAKANSLTYPTTPAVFMPATAIWSAKAMESFTIWKKKQGVPLTPCAVPKTAA